MCKRIRCEVCLRPGYTGCGQHVEQVLGDVPQGERCQCGQREIGIRSQAPEGAGEIGTGRGPRTRWW